MLGNVHTVLLLLAAAEGTQISRRVALSGAAAWACSCRRAANAEPPPPRLAGALYRCARGDQRLMAEKSADQLLRSELVLCGEHHSDRADHDLELALLQQMADAADTDGVGLALGVEMFERAKQPVLDAYVAGDLSDSELYEQTEWSTRWAWDFDAYAPIWREARERRIRIVALNTDTEVIRPVVVGGLPALSNASRSELVPDPMGFAQATTHPYFGRYVDAVIMSSYGIHVSEELIDSRATPANFFATSVLRDEAMASAGAAAISAGGATTASRGGGARSAGRALLLVGAGHCKYELGVAARLRRYAPPKARISTVLLNTLPSDTLSPDPRRLALALGPEADAPALADYVLYTQGGAVRVATPEESAAACDTCADDGPSPKKPTVSRSLMRQAAADGILST